MITAGRAPRPTRSSCCTTTMGLAGPGRPRHVPKIGTEDVSEPANAAGTLLDDRFTFGGLQSEGAN